MPSSPIDALTLHLFAKQYPWLGVRVRFNYGASFIASNGEPRRSYGHINVCAKCACTEQEKMPHVPEMTYYLVKKNTKVMKCQRCKRLLRKHHMEELCNTSTD